MDAGELPGYLWVLEGQYDNVFADVRPGDVTAESDALAPYFARVLRALDPAGTVLDVGCGAGAAALAIARAAPDARVVGVDASAQAVAVADAAAQGAGVRNARFVQGHAEVPPRGPFDRVLALSVFNLLPGKAEALRAWRRSVTPAGRLVLSDAFREHGESTRGAGALTARDFDALAAAEGWRVTAREDLTPLVHRLHAARAWPWSEYVRDGFRYALVTLTPA